MSAKTVVVKKSKISGLGIFAARSFRKGDLVIQWGSHRELSKEDLERLPAKEKEHVSFIENMYVLVPPEGWVNHSCDPNVRLDNFCYLAKRDIKKGEEITSDYREESAKGFSMKCNCGSKNCSGYIEVL